MARAKGAKVIPIRQYVPGGGVVERRPWPGTDREVGVAYLSAQQHQDAYVAARQVFKRRGIPIDESSAPWLAQEVAHQQCLAMLLESDCETYDANSRIFRTADEVRKELSSNAVNHFVNIQASMALDEAQKWNPDQDFREQVIRLFDLEDPGNLWGLLEQLREIKDALQSAGELPMTADDVAAALADDETEPSA